MFIQSGAKFSDGSVYQIPSWLRGPVGLCGGAQAYYFGRPFNGLGYEVLVSPYPPAAWPDLWRLDVDFEDAPGIIASFIELLDELNVYVLDSESCLTRGGQGYSATFICDCRQYATEIDRDSAERAHDTKVELLGLEALITGHIIEQLWFDSSSSPRVRVKRLQSYSRLARLAHAYFGSLDDVPCVKVANGCLAFPPNFQHRLLDECRVQDGSPCQYAVVTDTKDRILRLILSRQGKDVATFRIYFSRHDWCLGTILSMLRDGRFNLVEKRLRYAAPDCVAGGVDNDNHYMTLEGAVVYLGNNDKDVSEMLIGFLKRLERVMSPHVVVDFDAVGAVSHGGLAQ